MFFTWLINALRNPSIHFLMKSQSPLKVWYNAFKRMIIPVKLTSCFNNIVQHLSVPLSVCPCDVSNTLEFSDWPSAKIQLRKRGKTCKNNEERKRFSITSQLLMSLGVKHASSCEGFRCSLYLPPPFSLNFAPIPFPLCHLPVTVLSLFCPSVYSPRSYALLIFSRGGQMSSLPQSKRYAFIYFTSSPGNFSLKSCFGWKMSWPLVLNVHFKQWQFWFLSLSTFRLHHAAG